MSKCYIDGLTAASRLEMHPTCVLREWIEVKEDKAKAAGKGKSVKPSLEDGEVGEPGEAGGDGIRALAAAEDGVDHGDATTATLAAGDRTDDDWHEHSKRLYRAVIRAGKQPGAEDDVDLCAEVEVFPDYPHRPPAFTLTLVRAVKPTPLPPSELDVGEAKKWSQDADAGDALNDLRLMEEEVNVRCLSLVPCGAENETLGYQVVRLMQALDAAAACERWGGANDEAASMRQMRRGRERRKELPLLRGHDA